MVDHEITLVDGEHDIIKLICSCSKFTAEVTDLKYVQPVSERHLLHSAVWPFEEPPRSAKWPHNTKEDDEAE